MPIPESELRAILEKSFDSATIEIKDLAGDDDHYHVTIAACEFQGKSRVQQHIMVNEALKGILGDQLHALALTTKVKN